MFHSLTKVKILSLCIDELSMKKKYKYTCMVVCFAIFIWVTGFILLCNQQTEYAPCNLVDFYSAAPLTSGNLIQT